MRHYQEVNNYTFTNLLLSGWPPAKLVFVHFIFISSSFYDILRCFMSVSCSFHGGQGLLPVERALGAATRWALGFEIPKSS